MTRTDEELRSAVRRLGLHGLVAHWDDVRHTGWLPQLVDYEQNERQRRSLERRLRSARLGRFKPLCDFDWQWPKKIDRLAVEELCALEFLTAHSLDSHFTHSLDSHLKAPISGPPMCGCLRCDLRAVGATAGVRNRRLSVTLQVTYRGA